MTIFEKLAQIQQELVAPKGQKNTFGNYNYRSCEDIEHAVKPLLKKYNSTIVMDGGSMSVVEDRIYMTVKVIFIDLDTGDQYMTSATVREEESKKGMDATQVSGACISYARKYALAGLLMIDNEKDADTDSYTKKKKDAEEDEKHADEVEFVQNAKISEAKVGVLKKMCSTESVSIEKLCEAYKVKSLEDLTEKHFQNINAHWGKVKEVCHA
jgi:hypothetical protein